MDEVQGALHSTDGVNLIGFDASVMGMVEVAYEIRDHGEVMIGSEETEPGDGWPYDLILQGLVNNPAWSSIELGQAIVDRFYESCGDDYTQSVIDLSELDTLASTISSFAQSLMDNWNTDEAAVKSAASEVMSQIENVVIHEQHGSGWPGAQGLAVYFPLTSGEFDSDYESVIDFTNDTQWEEFLQEFYNSMGESWIFQRRAITQQFIYPEHVDLYHFCELLNTETEDYYTRSEISREYLGGGTAWDFHYDEASWTYNLPFDFPFFGETIPAGSTIYVCINGYIDFNDFNIDYSNSGSELANNKRIAPCWIDLKTNGSAQSGEDVYITENAGSLVFRWVAQTYSGAVPVNVELILYADGRIQFNYDGGNDLSATPYSPTIGISKGDGINCYFAVHNGQKVLTDVDSVLFTPINSVPPSPPGNPFPAHEATDVSVETDLDWDDCPRATSYDVYFGTASPPPYLTETVDSYLDVGSLNAGTTYCWKIVAKNDYGETPGEEWQFTTCTMPGAFSSLSPSSGSIDAPIGTDLDWEDSSGATSYDVYFGSSSPAPYIETTTESYYDPGTLDYSATYYWKIVAKNDCGSTEGSEWNFTTIIPPPPVPEIDIKVDSTDIADGGSYDFGSHSMGADTDVTFTIENTGNADLILSGSPIITITGADADQFSVQQQPTSPVTADGGSTTFIIWFSPTSGGSKIASISIANNDGDENPYDITLEGTGVVLTGSLTVTVEPQRAIDAGAQWKRLCTTTWYDSGYTESNIPVGSVIVEFKEIAGWLKPDNEIVFIPGGDTAVVTGIYTQLFGSGVFADSGQSLGSNPSIDIKLGDVDGDGDIDAFVANASYQANKLWLNDGNGTFTDSGQSLGGSSSYGLALGDMDGDGDIDAFVANLGSANRVWLNDGNGTFTDSGQNLGSSNSYGIVLGDVDCDGDLDAFVANAINQANKVWLNDGSGTFTDSGQSLGNSSSAGIALGDVDGDGDLDVFVANSGSNKVWLNDGSGTFTNSGQSLGSSSSYGIALGDVDGDGDLDAFVANYSSQANSVWLNDGNGTFIDSGQSLGSSSSFGGVLGDVDGDGDLDAYVANWLSANKVWLNDGSGIFTDSGQGLGGSSSYGVARGDVDRDGDLDALVANSGANRLWLNACVLPEITDHPQGQTIDYKTTAALGVTATSVQTLSYQWYQGDSGDTSTPVGEDSDSYTTPNLTETTSYWVRVSNACGSVDSETAIICVLPATPINLSPSDGSTDAPNDTDLDWEDSGAATSYDVYFGTASPPSYLTETVDSYLDTGSLNAGTTYYWKIVAKNDYGEAHGEEWSFTTGGIQQYSLTIFAGEGGMTDPAPDTYTYDSGTEVTITAQPESGYEFNVWNGDVPSGHETDNPLTLTIDSNKSLTANFLISQYTLIIIAGEGGTTNPASGSHTCNCGTAVAVTAIADTGCRFENWSGDISSTDNPVEIIMDSDKTITANFIRQYTLTIAAGSGGTTNPSPGSYAHDAGASVSVTALPNSGYNFSGWSWDASGKTETITITMDSDKSIKASFIKKPTNGDDQGGGCFIATAAYGSPLHPHIDILRQFRDKYLMTNKLGRKFVAMYYKYSPSVAERIAKCKILKVFIRIQLLPLVALGYSMVYFGPINTAFVSVLMLPIFLIQYSRRKFRRKKTKAAKA